MKSDLARHVPRPWRVAIAMACLILAGCNQASPSQPAATGSAVASTGVASSPSGSAIAPPASESAHVTPLPSVSQGPVSTAPPDGPAASPDAGPANLRVVESGFTAFAEDGNNFASFAAILDNPNARWAAFQMQVTIDFFDADDAFVAGEELFVQILPGQRTALVGEAFGAGRATRMEVNLPDDTTAFEPNRTPGDLFRISGLALSHRDGLNLTRGRLTSRAPSEESLVQLTAVYRNGRGAIIGGAVGGVDSIGSGATLTFEIIDSAPHPSIARTEAYWQVSGVRR